LRRKLFIHIGPAKTGTSAVQHSLQEHDNSVVLYPRAGRWTDGSHHNLAFNFFEAYERPEVVREPIDDLFDRVVTEARGSDRNILISSEVLAGRKRLPAFVETLLRKLGADFEAELIFVARDHFERASSVYNQRVKDAALRETRDPDQFLIEQAAKLCYAPMLKPLLQAKLDVAVIDYHPAESFTRRFFSHMGFPESAVPATHTRNVSLSTKALVATLAANRVCRNDQERAAVIAALNTMPRRFAPSEFIFGQGAVTAVEDVFRRDCTFLAKRFGVYCAQREERQECRFSIGPDEFAEIETALRSCPAPTVVEAIRKYVRPA
jgi:hypothetical protein